jgi:Tfp pilus assembly protein PilF
MTKDKLTKVKTEMKRMSDALKEYDRQYATGNIGYCSKERGTIRRASMDLTRALANLRKY